MRSIKVNGSPTGPHPYKGKGSFYGGKGKAKGEKSLLPKFLLGRDNAGTDTHGVRLDFNYQLNKVHRGSRWGRVFQGVAFVRTTWLSYSSP